MAIRNKDGSIYQVTGSLQQYDPANPEMDLFNSYDQEAIAIGGSPIYYYEVFINSNTIDKLRWEDRGKLFSQHPVCLYGLYNPQTSQNFQNMFGIDSGTGEMTFEFNYRQVLCTLGHPPKVGSRLFTPHKRENWVIVQKGVEEFKMWGELRLHLLCEKFQESLTVGEGKVTQSQPKGFKVNDVRNCP